MTHQEDNPKPSIEGSSTPTLSDAAKAAILAQFEAPESKDEAEREPKIKAKIFRGENEYCNVFAMDKDKIIEEKQSQFGVSHIHALRFQTVIALTDKNVTNGSGYSIRGDGVTIPINKILLNERVEGEVPNTKRYRIIFTFLITT